MTDLTERTTRLNMTKHDRLEWAISVVEQDAERDRIGVAAHIVLEELRRLQRIAEEKP